MAYYALRVGYGRRVARDQAKARLEEIRQKMPMARTADEYAEIARAVAASS